jgi:hypothetical protein
MELFPVPHPIPLHTADRLERTFEALSQCVESSGEESWVMRILAMLISRCLDHFVAMIEDLLAKIRAGTIVLPDWAYEQSAIPAQCGTYRPVHFAPQSAPATRARSSGHPAPARPTRAAITRPATASPAIPAPPRRMFPSGTPPRRHAPRPTPAPPQPRISQKIALGPRGFARPIRFDIETISISPW